MGVRVGVCVGVLVGVCVGVKVGVFVAVGVGLPVINYRVIVNVVLSIQEIHAKQIGLASFAVDGNIEVVTDHTPVKRNGETCESTV